MSKIKTLASGIGWGTISTVAVTGFQLVFMAVMARLLDPTDFGLVAIANVSLKFFSYFAQLGTAPALIQKPTLEDGDIAAALTVSLGISCLFAVLALLTAPLFEVFFAMNGLADVIKVLAVNFIIGGFAVVSNGLLRRKATFKALAIIEVVSYVVGYGLVGLTAAEQGYEVWALVAAFMTQNLLSAVLSYLVIRHSLRLSHSPAQRRHFLSYGGRYSVIGFLEFLTANLDAMVVGKFMGAAPSGYYNRALLLANLPVQQPANILTKTLFPIMSSIGDQFDKQVISFQLSILLVGSYAFAVSAGIYVAAEDVVSVILGDKWLAAIPLLKILSLSVGPIYITHVAGVALDSMNKLRIKLKIQLSIFLLLVALMLICLPMNDAIYIAAAVVVAEWLRLLVMLAALNKILKISLYETLLTALSITMIALASASLIWLSMELMTELHDKNIRLGLEILSGALGLLSGLFLARYTAARIHAAQFLAERVGLVRKLLPKVT